MVIKLKFGSAEEIFKVQEESSKMQIEHADDVDVGPKLETCREIGHVLGP